MEAFNNPDKLTAELVSRANGYKSRTNAFYIDVQVSFGTWLQQRFNY